MFAKNHGKDGSRFKGYRNYRKLQREMSGMKWIASSVKTVVESEKLKIDGTIARREGFI